MTDGFMDVFDKRGMAEQKILTLFENMKFSSTEDLANILWREFQVRQHKQNEKHDDSTIIIAEYGEGEKNDNK